MKFGKSKEEAEAAPSRGGGGQGFMKYMKSGENMLQIVDEPDKWVWYWEHYNPGGFPFPCLEDDRDNCPGCQSDNEKMKKASRKIAFNAMSEYNGEQYLNVWKVPKTVADKLENRAQRIGSITDRPYLVTRIETKSGNKTNYDYDIEGMEKGVAAYEQEHWTDPSELLAQAYEDAWGDDAKVRAAQAKPKAEPKADDSPPWKQEDESKEQEVTEEELRGMSVMQLVRLCDKEGLGEIPSTAQNPNDIVDWMLTKV